MKTITFALFGVLLTTSIALASWQDTFSTDFAKNGAATVAGALALGASPGEIIDIASAAGIEPETLVAAMCNAGLSAQDLEGFLDKLGNMSVNALSAACGSQQNIAYDSKFPGSSSQTRNTLSVSPGTNYAGEPASGHNFK